MSRRRGTTGHRLSWSRADFMAPDAVTLVTAVSRHAKDNSLPYGLRAQLYGVKTAGIHALFRQDRLQPDHVSQGPWHFGETLARAVADHPAAQRDRTHSLLSRALQTGVPLDPHELLAAGLTLSDLPLPNLTRRSTLATLSDSQRSRFDPQGSWLVGFSEPGRPHGDSWCDLHQPYRTVATWTEVHALPLTAEARLDPGGYGHRPDAEFRRAFPLRDVLDALNVTGLRPVTAEHTNAPRTARPI